MYHAIVRGKLDRVFEALTEENYEPVLASLADRLSMSFTEITRSAAFAAPLTRRGGGMIGFRASCQN